MLNKKQFSRLGLSGLHLLVGALLIAAFSFSTAQAGTGVALTNTISAGITTYIPYASTTHFKLGADSLLEGAAGNLVATAGDSIQIQAPTGFTLNKDSIVTITATGGLAFDTTGFFTKFGITQTSASTIQVKANTVLSGGTGVYYLSVDVSTASTTASTLIISGLYAQWLTATTAKYDSSTTAVRVAFSQKSVVANAQNLNYIVAVPGPASQLVFGARIPAATQTVGNYINTTAGGTTSVDTTKGIVVFYEDAAGNLTASGLSAPSVGVLLTGSSTPGNGVLSGSGTTHSQLANHNDIIGISFDGLTYTKTQTVDLTFTLGTSTINTVTTSLATGIAFAAGAAANISVVLDPAKAPNNIDTVSVAQVNPSVYWIVTVTDKYSNPILNASVTTTESTPHDGAASIKGGSNTNGGGSTNGAGNLTSDVEFLAGTNFVGADTLIFKTGTIQAIQVVVITPGPAAGLFVDYAGTASGSAVTEEIAAGTTVYARAFLKDVYGNPVNAASASAITFTINGKNGKGTSLGTAVLTNLTTESQYPNAVQTAVGVAVPYTVSTNVIPNPDSVLATAGSYSLQLTIQNRSQVPVTFKLCQLPGGDSSVVVSAKYATSVAFQDSAWDTYSNPVNNPGTPTIAPLKSSYNLYGLTNGLTKFAGTVDTVAADTLLPTALGVYTLTVSSGTKEGMDTLKTSSASSSVALSAPVWVTPTAYTVLAFTPVKDTTAIAGQPQLFTVEKQDKYNNHIDWGLAGGNARGTIGAYTAPTKGTGSGQIYADSLALTVDTVTTGKNRGGVITKANTSGKAGVASVGGNLDMTAKFIPFTGGIDTQKVYASLSGAPNDTSIIYSVATGSFKSFTAAITAIDLSAKSGDSVFTANAGDSVQVTITAFDTAGHQIYTYGAGGQSFILNHTSVTTNTAKDTTFYFTYVDTRGKYVKYGANKFGVPAISDTVFKAGVATIWLHKFVVDSVNTVSIIGGGFTATTLASVKFKPLDVTASGADGHWLVVITDTLKSTGALDFTVTPRDYYYNVSPTQQVIVNVASNQTSGFNVGSNPKVVMGATSFIGTLSSGASGSLIIYVFSSDNSALYGQSAATPIIITGIKEASNVAPKAYSLSQNYPNPFNPTTNINFSLVKPSNVTLAVYNVLGQKVATIVNQFMQAGSYTYQFDASRLASGVYIYRIEAGNFVSIKKFVLLK